MYVDLITEEEGKQTNMTWERNWKIVISMSTLDAFAVGDHASSYWIEKSLLLFKLLLFDNDNIQLVDGSVKVYAKEG